MSRFEPTAEGLKTLGFHFLAEAKAQLMREGKVTAHLMLLHAKDGSRDLAIDYGEFADSRPAKSELARRARGLIARHGFSAAVSVSDAWGLMPGDEDPAIYEAFMNSEYTMPEINAIFGVGRLTEQVTVAVESHAGVAMMILCRYHRAQDGKVESFEEPIMSDIFGGRLRLFGEIQRPR